MLLRTTLLLFFLVFITTTAPGPQAAVVVVQPVPTELSSPAASEAAAPAEAIKLNWRQRLVLKLATKKLAKAQARASLRNGKADPDPIKTHPLATVALIFLLSSFLISIFGFIGAIVCGSIAQRRIEEQPYAYKGYDLAKVCKILGIIFLALSIFLIFLFIAALAAVA